VIIGLANPREAVESAVNCARITHQAPLTLDAVRYLAGLLAGALAGASKEELLSPHFSPAPGLWESVTLKQRVKDVAAGSWRRSRPRAIVVGANAAAGALEAALWAFERGSSPAECLGIAASLGGDADITATIVGQLAGAHYGATALPTAWRAVLARGDEIEAMADKLLEAGRPPA
jgi:ADP-ribosylglycohydrolase